MVTGQKLTGIFSNAATSAWESTKGLITAIVPSARSLKNAGLSTLLVGSSFFGLNPISNSVAPISKADADIVTIDADARLASGTNSELLPLYDADIYKSYIEFDTNDAVLTDSGTFGTINFHEYTITGSAYTRIFNSDLEQIAEAQTTQFRLTINNFGSGSDFSGSFRFLAPDEGTPHFTGDVIRSGLLLDNLDTGVMGSDLDAFLNYGLSNGFDNHDGSINLGHINTSNGVRASLSDNTTGYRFSMTTSVPEPSSLALLGALGAGGAALRRRRSPSPC